MEGGLACADETVPGDVLAADDGLEEEAVLGVVGDAEVGHAGGDEVGGDLDVDGDAVALLFVQDELLDGGERGEGGQFLGRSQFESWKANWSTHCSVHRVLGIERRKKWGTRRVGLNTRLLFKGGDIPQVVDDVGKSKAARHGRNMIDAGSSEKEKLHRLNSNDHHRRTPSSTVPHCRIARADYDHTAIQLQPDGRCSHSLDVLPFRSRALARSDTRNLAFD